MAIEGTNCRMEVRILSIDGGGYLGLATASFIRAIEKYYKIRFSEIFDFFCGTSTGGIIALALAAGASGEELVELYKTMGPRVFPRRAWPRWGLFGPRYGNKPLQEVLEAHFQGTTFDEVYNRGKKVLVTAFNVSTGQPRLFKTNHSPDLKRDGQLKLVDVAMATSAAPTYFPLVPVFNPHDGAEEVYCDGGVVANHPALLGFTEALSYLSIKPKNIRLLSLSTPRENLAEGTRSRKLSRGLMGWRKALPSIFIDAPSMIAHGVLERIVKSYDDPKPVYVRIALENKEGLALDRVDAEATNTLQQIGSTKAAEIAVRKQIEPIIMKEPKNGRHPETVRTIP
jgi:uncharacterized protein